MDQQGPKPQQSRPPLPPRPPHPLREARLETGSPEEKMPPRKIARSLRQWPAAWMYFDTLRLFNTTHCSHVEPLSMNCFYCRVPQFLVRMINRDWNDLRVRPTILSRPIEPSNESSDGALSKFKKSKISSTPCLTGTACLALPQHSRLMGDALAFQNR